MKLIVAYRNNDLFAKYLAAVWEALRALGHEVMLNVFPPETAEADAQATMVSILESQPSGIAYIHDSTCTLPEEASEQIYQMEIRTRHILLDEIFQTLVWDRFHGTSRTFEEGFKALLKMIVQDKQITSVHIIIEHLVDHIGGFQDVEWMLHSKDGSECLAAEIGWHVKYVLPWRPEEYITNHIRLASALAACSQDDSALLIADRHILYKEMEESMAGRIIHWKHRCLLFCLPFSNTAGHLVQMGKLTEPFTTDSLLAELRRKL